MIPKTTCNVNKCIAYTRRYGNSETSVESIQSRTHSSPGENTKYNTYYESTWKVCKTQIDRLHSEFIFSKVKGIYHLKKIDC